jgi:hypothetical protein
MIRELMIANKLNVAIVISTRVFFHLVAFDITPSSCALHWVVNNFQRAFLSRQDIGQEIVCHF